MRLVTVTPAAVLPVTPAGLAAFGRIDDATDAVIPGFIEAAVAAAESYTRRSFITRTYRLWLDLTGRRAEWEPGYYQLPVNYFDGSLPSVYDLPMGPVSEIVSVTTYDSLNDDTAFTGYGLYGDRLILNAGVTWPTNLRAAHAAAIVYKAGYGLAAADVPPPIRTAVMIHAGMLYDTRGACGCDLPPVCEQMLKPYRIELL